MSHINDTPDQIKQAEFARNLFRVTTPVGVKHSEVTAPSFWVHVAPKFAAGDKIEVFAEDGSFYMELLVRDASRVHLLVGVLTLKEFGVSKGKAKPEDPDFTFEFKGPQRKWSVIRKSDLEIIKDGFVSAEVAAAYLEENRELVA